MQLGFRNAEVPNVPAALIDAVLERADEAPEREAFRDGRGAVHSSELFAASGRFATASAARRAQPATVLLLGLPADRRHLVA